MSLMGMGALSMGAGDSGAKISKFVEYPEQLNLGPFMSQPSQVFGSPSPTFFPSPPHSP